MKAAGCRRGRSASRQRYDFARGRESRGGLLVNDGRTAEDRLDRYPVLRVRQDARVLARGPALHARTACQRRLGDPSGPCGKRTQCVVGPNAAKTFGQEEPIPFRPYTTDQEREVERLVEIGATR